MGNSIVGISEGRITTLGVNLVISGLVAPGVINADPILGPLKDNGGPTLTRFLAYSSPAIGAGDPQVDIEEGVTTDQRGFDRVIDGKVDLGAFEKSTPAPIPPTDLVVSSPGDDRDDDFGPGQLSLREALDIANARPGPSVITFAPGLTGTLDPLVDGPLYVRADVQILGPGSDLLSIDGGQTVNFLQIEGGVPDQPMVTIQDLTLTGGIANTFMPDVITNDGNLTLKNCTITGGQGTFDFQTSEIYSIGPLSVINCTISNNTDVTVIASTGGIYMSHSTVSGNVDSLGMGISGNVDSLAWASLEGGPWTALSSRTTPGALTLVDFEVTVTNSVISDNGGIYEGHGISNFGGTLTVVNSTIAGNTAVMGGGVFMSGDFYGNSPATTTLINVTIAGNTASTGAGVEVDSYGTLIISNTIIGNNVGPEVSTGSTNIFTEPIPLGVVEVRGPNLVEGGLDGFPEVLSADPKLGPLQDNGGPTQTMALLAGSPAIDKGDNTLVPIDPSTGLPVTTDQRGFTRVVNGTVDIGAFEDQVVVTTPADAQATTAGSVATVGLGSFADSAINAGNSTVVVDFGDGSPTMTLLNVRRLAGQRHPHLRLDRHLHRHRDGHGSVQRRQPRHARRGRLDADGDLGQPLERRARFRTARDIYRNGHHPGRRPDSEFQRRHGHLLRRHDGAGQRDALGQPGDSHPDDPRGARGRLAHDHRQLQR